MHDYKTLDARWIVFGRILGRGCGNVLAYYIVKSIGVRVWTFCLKHRKMNVVYWVVWTTWNEQWKNLLHV